MHGVAALLVAAALAHVLARALRLPAIPFLLLGGVALARLDPPPGHLLDDAVLLGVSFLLFQVGLELDPRRMRAQRSAAIQVGVGQFLILGVLGALGASALGFTLLEATYLGVALTASSTLVGVRLLQRRRQMFEPFGRLVLGVLLTQDILVLLAIPVLGLVRGEPSVALRSLVGLALLGGLTALVRTRVAPLLLRVADERETLLLGSLTVLFVFMGTADLLALPPVVGAFLAGVALARFPVNGVVRIEMAPIGDFFTALFFTALGAVVSLPTPTELLQAGALALLVVFVTVPGVALLAERAGFSARAGIEAGLLLSQTSEISLVIGLTGMLQGHIDAGIFTVIALVTLVTMLATPLLATDRVAWALLHLHPERRRAPIDPMASGHVLLLGAGSTGMPLIEDLILVGCGLVVVDDDPAVVARLREAGVETVRGDAADPVVLARAGVSRARAIVATVRRARDTAPIFAAASGVPVLVRVFDEADARWVTEQGGTPILYSRVTANGLMDWVEENAAELETSLARRTP